MMAAAAGPGRGLTYTSPSVEVVVIASCDGVLSKAKLDGVMPAFSLNVLTGGQRDKDGVCDCAGTSGAR
jgi:hypothetical protein